MEHIKLTDKVTVNDKSTAPIKGVVVMKDENGKIIFKKNNLVVRLGRAILKNLFYSSIKENNDNITMKSPMYNPTIKIGTGTGITTDSTTNLTSPIEVTLTSIEEKDTGIDDIYIKFSSTISGSGLTAINMCELGIFLDEVLFSRIVFDPLPLTSGNSYNLDYYLYF